MAYPLIFDHQTTIELFNRIDNLKNDSKHLWGKMNVAQMLAHCCLPYKVFFKETTYKVPFLFKLFFKGYLKKKMTNEIPYTQNLPTAKNFVVADERDFETEKNALKQYILETEKQGLSYLINFKHPLIGYLTETEWSNLLYKHLDHHFRQFGV